MSKDGCSRQKESRWREIRTTCHHPRRTPMNLVSARNRMARIRHRLDLTAIQDYKYTLTYNDQLSQSIIPAMIPFESPTHLTFSGNRRPRNCPVPIMG